MIQQPAQSVAGDFNYLAGASGDRADLSRGAGQVRDFAGELAFAMDGELFWLVARQVDNGDLNGTTTGAAITITNTTISYNSSQGGLGSATGTGGDAFGGGADIFTSGSQLSNVCRWRRIR